MKKARIVKIFACALCTAVLFALPCIAAVRTSEDVYTLEDFGHSVGNFMAGDNTERVVRCEAPFGDEGDDELRSCLEVVSKYSEVGLLRAASAKFIKPLDLTDYRKLAYDIFVPIYEADPDAVYYTRLTLYSSDGSSTEHLANIKGDEWCHVEADIGTWDGRYSITEAELAYVVDTAQSGYVSDSFFIDEIYAFDTVDRELTERFLFDRFETENSEGEFFADKSALTVSSDSFNSFSISAAVFMPKIEYHVNCLRIKLTNHTVSDTLTLHYTTSDTQANTEDKTVSVPITPMSEEKYYYIYVGNASMLRTIELEFDEGGGSVMIDSISVISAYEAKKYDACGSVNICRLSDDLRSVSFYGEIDRDVALNNQESRIAVYAYESEELPSLEELASMEPVITGDMTTRFEFSWQLPADNPYACYSRFLAVVIHSDGSYMLIAPPFYIDNPERRSENMGSLAVDAKGFSADDISLVGETDSGITQLTADVLRVFVSREKGEQFIYNGKLYYLDSEYLGQLSKKLEVLSRSGVSVLLRYTNVGVMAKEALNAMYDNDSYISYDKITDLPGGNDYVGALSAYTASEWCSKGLAVGVIYGKSENIIPDGTDNVSEMIAYTARELCKVYFNLSSVNSGAKVYISVTDLFDVDPATNVRELPINEYLSTLVKQTSEYGSYGWEIAVEVTSQEKGSNGDRISVDNCKRLTDLLPQIGCGDKQLVFCDDAYTSADMRLSARVKQYVVGYYSAYFNDRIDAYIAIAGDRAESISETVRYIDTVDADVMTYTALIALKADSLDDVISGFDKNKLPSRRLSYAEASLDVPSGIKGAYNYFVFDSVSNLNSVDAGYYCGDMQIVREGDMAMSVDLDPHLYGYDGIGAWMGITHTFEYTENLEYTPIISVRMRLDCAAPTDEGGVPVKLVLLSENERFESVGRIEAGKWTTVYFEIGEFDGIEDTKSLQLLVGDGEIGSAKLLVKEIKGLSRDYNDESLESVIAEERLKKRTPDEEMSNTAYLWMGGAAFIALATVITVALLSRKRGDGHE